MIICGTTDLTETGRRGGITTRGVWTEIHYEGLVDTVKAALPTLASQGWDVEYDLTNPPKGRLIIRTPDYGDGEGAGIVQTQFDLVTNLAQRSAYEHHRSLALGQETIDSIRAGIKANEKPTLTGDASTLYDMIAASQDSFVCSQFVFRISKTFVNGADIVVAYDNVNLVYSSAALITETGPTALYQAAIIQAATAYLRDTYGNSTPSGHTFGWLKQAPQLQNVAGNRSVLVIEYWLEAWRNYFYS